MRVKIYMSDEGFGHIVRQRAIVKELYKQFDNIHVTIQTGKNFDFATKNIKHQASVRKFNNIVWHKQSDRSPDPKKINDYYSDYIKESERFIESEINSFNYDFVITDFCYEAFEIADRCKVPSFGSCHFTWDWFLEHFFTDNLKHSLITRWNRQASLAKTLFFPPFTPKEILEKYKNHLMVPFIVKDDIAHKKWPVNEGDPLKILFMDSGAGIMRDRIIHVINSFKHENFQRNIVFGVPSSIESHLKNVFSIPKDHLMIDYVMNADFVIGRPGFNTVSECLTCKVPMLLISETMNPEMEHNIQALVEENVAEFLPLEDLERNFEEILDNYISSKLVQCQTNLLYKNYEMTGAMHIVQNIKKQMSC